MSMTSNLACCSEESWDMGRYVGGCACVFTEVFLSPSKRCCLGYLERRTCQKNEMILTPTKPMGLTPRTDALGPHPGPSFVATPLRQHIFGCNRS